MKSSHFSGILKGFILLLVFFTQNAFADRDDPLVTTFDIGGVSKRLYVEVRDFPNTVSDATIEVLKIKITNWAVSYWRLYEGGITDEEYTFRSPASGRDSDGVETLKIYYKLGGRASGKVEIDENYLRTGNYIRSGWTRISGPAAITTPDIEIELKFAIAHEIFHNIQFGYSDINLRYGETFEEGTAQLAPSLIIPEINRLASTTISCESRYLKFPGSQMWFRNGDTEGANVCASALWWKYLTQQLSKLDRTGIDHGFDTLARLLSHLETPTGWRQRSIDNLMFVDDFSGNDIEDILVTSDLYLGIVSPMFFNPTTVGVISDGGRFGGGWKFHHTDEVVGSGDMVGDKGAEFIIKNETHLGIIGMEDGNFKSHGIRLFGYTLGPEGWRVQATDQIVATGDFDGDGKSEFLIKSDTHLGLVEYSSRGFKTLSVRSMGHPLVGGGWVLSPNDEIIGIGNFDDNSRMEFLIKSSSHIGIIGYDNGNQVFKSLGAKLLSSIPGTTSQIKAGKLRTAGPNSLILTQPNELRVFDLGTNGGLDEISNIPNSLLPRGFELIDALIDMDGDGLDDLVVKNANGTLVVGKLELGSNSFTEIARAPAGVQLSDGFVNSQYRDRLTPDRDYQIIASGDFDGDGKGELFVRDSPLNIILELNTSNGFILGQGVEDNERFDSLITMLDTFIRNESIGQRNLHDMFTDFTVANYVNSLVGSSITNIYRYSDELRYPGAIDYDNDLNTPPVTFAFDGNVDGGGTVPIDQETWSSQYFRFNSSLGQVDISLQLEHGIDNVTHTLLVVEGNRLISKISYTGRQFSSSIDLGTNQNAILIVTSFEAPLSYQISAVGK